MATLEDFIKAVQDDLGVITGIRKAPDYPPEQLNVFPFIMVYPGKGEWNSDTPGGKRWLGSVIVELHIARVDLARDVEAALGYYESIPNALLKPVATMAGDRFVSTIDTFGTIDEYFGKLDWADTQTIGWRWTINGIKMRSDIT